MALKEIIEYKKQLIKQKKSVVNDVKPCDRSFFDALKKDDSAFIFEIKPSSPSMGVIKSDVDPKTIAEIYAPFADAISVLADEKFFGGSLENVQKVSLAQKLPVLCKDVVVSPLQVLEARAHGAHMVLLMLSVLSDQEYLECEKVAYDLNMSIICEVHTEQEMIRAKALRAKIIGINNRDLFTLKIDLETTKKLVALAPNDAFLISESGYKKRSQIMANAHLVDGFLVGSSLMKACRIDLAVRELLFGRVKICGLTNAKDAKASYDAGAFYGGLNFWSKSKRFISVDQALSVKNSTPLNWGGIFVAQALDEVKDIALKLKLDFVQLHGDESDDYIRDLKKLLPLTEIWQAIRLKPGDHIKKSPHADRVLLDSYSSEQGGTGTSFSWQDYNGYEDKVMAGGINPDNVCKAASFDPFAIDICSGVEEAFGLKSANKLAATFSNLRPKKIGFPL